MGEVREHARMMVLSAGFPGLGMAIWPWEDGEQVVAV